MEKADRGQRASVNFQTEHITAKGTTRISVQTPQGRQVSGSCFVATACFGDYDHPTVMVLRQFRDLTLMENRAGRAFIIFYYRRGPQLARFVERMPVLKLPRWALGLCEAVVGLSRASAVARFRREVAVFPKPKR